MPVGSGAAWWRSPHQKSAEREKKVREGRKEREKRGQREERKGGERKRDKTPPSPLGTQWRNFAWGCPWARDD